MHKYVKSRSTAAIHRTRLFAFQEANIDIAALVDQPILQ